MRGGWRHLPPASRLAVSLGWEVAFFTPQSPLPYPTPTTPQKVSPTPLLAALVED